MTRQFSGSRLKRVFRTDIDQSAGQPIGTVADCREAVGHSDVPDETSEHCGGAVPVIASIDDPAVIEKILNPHRAPRCRRRLTPRPTRAARQVEWRTALATVDRHGQCRVTALLRRRSFTAHHAAEFLALLAAEAASSAAPHPRIRPCLRAPSAFPQAYRTPGRPFIRLICPP